MPHIAPPCLEDISIIEARRDWLAVYKPAGLLSVPGRAPENRDSLYTRLLERYDNVHIVHRLDMHTSGIVIVPIGKAALSHLARQFQERKIDKTYEAVVFGKPESSQGLVDLPLICDWPNRPLQKVCFEHGKPSQTEYRTLETLDQTTRLALHPITGRSHQLRVHCQALGTPIVGDEFYAPEAVQTMAARLLLHAREIRFRDPGSNDWVSVSSPTPF